MFATTDCSLVPPSPYLSLFLLLPPSIPVFSSLSLSLPPYCHPSLQVFSSPCLSSWLPSLLSFALFLPLSLPPFSHPPTLLLNYHHFHTTLTANYRGRNFFLTPLPYCHHLTSLTKPSSSSSLSLLHPNHLTSLTMPSPTCSTPPRSTSSPSHLHF